MKIKIKLLVFVFFILCLICPASAWLTGYDYRIPIEINNTGDTLTDYQYKLTLNTSSLVSTGKMQEDGSDCRITNTTDVLQSFWNETPFNDSNTIIWVNASSLDNVLNTTHYFYYGKSGASSLIDGDATFSFFEDFEGDYEISNQWTRYASNPILSKNATSGSWDYYFVNSPYIATYANGTAYQDVGGNYYMYYSGSGNADSRPFNDDRVGLALSTDLYNWTRADTVISGAGHVGLVLDFGADGTFDDADVQIGSIIVDNGTFHMWYTGNDNSASDNLKFGYANSTDGKNWTKSPSNPILSYGTVDDNDGVYAPHVILDGSTWKMWYTGKNTVGSPVFGVMYATAPFATPTVWTRYSNNYVYEYNQIENSMWGSYVWKDSINDYNMIFANYDALPYVFHWSNSTDGINWTHQGVIFEEGESGQWDDKFLLWVSQINVSGTWYSYYRATDTSDDHRIGVATSANRLPTPKVDTEFSKWDSAGDAFSINDSIKYAGSYSALGTGHATAVERELSNTIARTDGVITVQYRPEVQSGYQYLVRISDSSGTLYLISALADGHYQYHDGSWNNFPVDTLWSLGRWDEIIVDFDYGTDKYNVTINGTKISGSGLTLQGAGTQTDSIVVSTYNDVDDRNYFDNYFIREYISNEPIVTSGEEEEGAEGSYIPPDPTSLANSTSNFWVNYTWLAGSGNTTNTYNVSQNNSWTNGSSNTFMNTEVGAHGYSEIIVYAYNNSGNETLSAGYVTDNVTIPNNVISISDVSASYTLNEGETLSIDANYTDIDTDTGTFDDNSSVWNVEANTGLVSWVTSDGDNGVYNWHINVTDGYDSVSTQEFNVTVNDSIETVYFTNITGVYHFWNYTNIPELYTAINNNSVLSHNATTDIYVMHYPFYQNNSADSFNFNETVHLESNNDGSPSYFRWAGNVEFDNYTILGWNTISNITTPTADTTRAYIYCDNGATGNITNGNMSYLGYNSVGKYGIKLDDFDNGIISNNTFSYNYYGMNIGPDSENNTINLNFIHSNVITGLSIGDSAHFCSLTGNDIWSNGQQGVHVLASNNVNLTENDIQGNGQHGIKFESSTHATFTDNVINDTSGSYYDYRLESGSTNAIFINAVKASNYYSSQLDSSPLSFQNGIDYDIALTEESVIRDNLTSGSEAANVSVVSGTIGQLDVTSLTPSTSYNLKYTNGTLIESQTSDGSGDATFTSDLTTGNYIITLAYKPVITLESFTPVTFNTNYTGTVTISYMVNSTEPLNFSSLAFLYGLNHTIPAGGDMHNYISAPPNDIAHDGIYRASYRNLTPYLSWEFNTTITNNNVWQWGGYDNDSIEVSTSSINATHTWVNVTGVTEDILPSSFYISKTAMYDAPKTGFEINKQQGLIFKMWNLEEIRNRDADYLANMYFDTSWESTEPTHPIEIGYCNFSYDPATDDIDVSPYCAKFAEWNGTRWVDHSYDPGANASYVSPLTINASQVTDPIPTDINYVWLRSGSVPSKSFVLNATDYDPGITNISFAQTNTMWTYNEINGVTSSVAYTPSYFTTFARDYEELLHHLYIADDTGTWGHSEIFNESIGLSQIPVSPVSFEYFNVTCAEGYHDEEMDATYNQGTIGVGLHCPADPDSGTVSHNLTLHYYPNQTIVAVLNNTFTTDGSEYVEISVDTTPYYSSDTLYTLKCVSTDDEGSVATKWLVSYFALDADGNRGWVQDDQLLFWGMNDIPTLYTEVNNNSLISYDGGDDVYTMHIPFFKSKGNDTFNFNETVHLESLNNEDVAYFRFVGRTNFDDATILGWNTTSGTLAPITDTYRSYVYSLTMTCGNITNSNFSYLGSDIYQQEGLNFVSNDYPYLIHNTVFSNNAEGPIFEECSNFTISNCTISDNVNVGVGIYFSNNTTVENSTIDSNAGYGISVYEGFNNTIRYNDISNSGNYGIRFWSGAGNNTCTGNDISNSGSYDYYYSGASFGNYLIDPASSTNQIRVTDTSSLNIENTDNAAFSEDSSNTSYAYLTNFSMYVTGLSQTFDITQHNAIITPSTDKLKVWNVEWDDTLTFNASSDTALNPTWFNITNTSWASSIINVSINGTLTTTENTDATGLLTYNYSDSYSEKWFEFQLYGVTPTPTPTPTETVTPPPSGGSSSSSGTTGVGTSDEPLYNIDCRETGRIRNLQAGTETYYRTTKPDCTDIIKVTFTPTQNSPEQPILIEKLHNKSRFVIKEAPHTPYSYFNLYVGLFGFDEKTTNEKILFKVSKNWTEVNNVTPESVTLYIFDPSTTSWKSLPTILSHTDTLYYVYESESGATYGRFAIVGTDKVSLNIIEILTEKIEDIIPSIDISESKFITGATSLYNNLKEYIINLLPTSISFDAISNIFDNENTSTYIVAILTIILIAIISYFYNYEHGLIAGIIAIILMIIITILQDTTLIKIMSVEAGNIIVSTVAYTTTAFIISYIMGEKLK